jgi:anthranilate phosphoribosyltransferase
MKMYIEKCLTGQDLTESEASAALELIMTNQASDVQIAGLLIALRAKGETVEEIVGFARTMREHAVHITVDDSNAIDMCGTGGDGLGTFNISTVATLVAAGAGATVAKHGNRSVSSRSGSADLLAALGVNIQLPPEKVQQCVNTVGVGFLFAPMFHPAMKFAAKPRVELAVRTIFNMLGPITNPAGVQRQVVGAYALKVAGQLSRSLQKLGALKACVVHSDDGMDEVSIVSETTIFDVENGQPLRQRKVSAADFGLRQDSLDTALGGTIEQNAAIAMAILQGQPTPARKVVVANAGLGLYVAGKVADLKEGANLASESLESGRALQKLKDLVAFTTGQ